MVAKSKRLAAFVLIPRKLRILEISVYTFCLLHLSLPLVNRLNRVKLTQDMNNIVETFLQGRFSCR